MPYSVQIFNKKGKIIYYFVLYFVQIYFSFSFRKSISILYREIAVFHSIPGIVGTPLFLLPVPLSRLSLAQQNFDEINEQTPKPFIWSLLQSDRKNLPRS